MTIFVDGKPVEVDDLCTTFVYPGQTGISFNNVRRMAAP